MAAELTPPAPADAGPCVLFALRREARPFRRLGHARGAAPDAPCPAFVCGGAPPTLVLETGMGAAAAEAATGWLLARAPRPSAVVAAGFAGALRPGLTAGDLVLATEVADAEGNRWPATYPGRPLPPHLPVTTGRLLTVPALVADPAEKQRLGRLHGAVVVDMESAAVARVCHGAGVPFAALRAVSDDADAGLSPALAGLMRRGRVSPAAVLAAVARDPSLPRALWALARDTRRAARNLARGLAALLGHEGA